MAVFGAVIQPPVREMPDRQSELSSGRDVRFQLVRDHPPRAGALLPEKSGQQTPCSLCITAGLHDFVEDVAVLVHCPPQPVRLALDQDADLIKMPDIPRPGCLAAQPAGECGSEFHAPPANRLIRYDNPALEQHLLNQAKAQRKAEIQPHSMPNHLTRKTMPFVTRRRLAHRQKIPQPG